MTLLIGIIVGVLLGYWLFRISDALAMHRRSLDRIDHRQTDLVERIFRLERRIKRCEREPAPSAESGR